MAQKVFEAAINILTLMQFGIKYIPIHQYKNVQVEEIMRITKVFVSILRLQDANVEENGTKSTFIYSKNYRLIPSDIQPAQLYELA